MSGGVGRLIRRRQKVGSEIQAGVVQQKRVGRRQGRDAVEPFHLRSWLRHGGEALEDFSRNHALDTSLAPHNQLSQLNVLRQIVHLKSYPLVRELVEAGQLRLHGWWFELKNADVYAYEDDAGRFVLIDDQEAKCLLKRLA